MLTYTNKSMLTLKYIKNKKIKKSIFGDGLYKYGSYVMQVVRVTLVTKRLLLTAMITNGYVININWAYKFFGLRVERFILSITFIYNWKKRNFTFSFCRGRSRNVRSFKTHMLSYCSAR